MEAAVKALDEQKLELVKVILALKQEEAEEEGLVAENAGDNAGASVGAADGDAAENDNGDAGGDTEELEVSDSNLSTLHFFILPFSSKPNRIFFFFSQINPCRHPPSRRPPCKPYLGSRLGVTVEKSLYSWSVETRLWTRASLTVVVVGFWWFNVVGASSQRNSWYVNCL
ncbi:hypothetical protein P8452_36274 [Trifolium repens]|nr:hypothetical protein P8452_36274 [Trifolium repens]